ISTTHITSNITFMIETPCVFSLMTCSFSNRQALTNTITELRFVIQDTCFALFINRRLYLPASRCLYSQWDSNSIRFYTKRHCVHHWDTDSIASHLRNEYVCVIRMSLYIPVD
ncbi:hypothetical protein EWB00_001581, partial [Schistosoma japonicum]